ncbi:MAG TPA: response regulator [Thermoanaerobaculia bacterium]|jgi:PAS domain S-box-containing protein|nr:response regulator [Thermoanaerobaculia bacterium]
MAGHYPFSWKPADLFWVVISLLVLPPILYYPYASSTHRLPFSVRHDGRISSGGDFPCNDPANCLQLNDQVIQVGRITYDDFRKHRMLSLFKEFEANRSVPVRILRNGSPMTITVMSAPPAAHLINRLPATALLPFTFWLMGTLVILFLRPRDERWQVLVLFSYVNALWIASGMASEIRVAGSGVVFHAVVWLFMPLSLHLHLILPSSLTEKRFRIVVPLYAISIALAVLDSFHLLPDLFEYYLSFTIGVLGSLALLLARLFLKLPSAVKVADRIMLFGAVLGFGPILLFYMAVPAFFPAEKLPVQSGELYPWVLGLMLIAVPILPMSYIYAIYKHHISALEFRANRLLGAYGFTSLYITFYVVLLFSISLRWGPMNQKTIGATLALSLVFLAAALLLRGRFQALVDRHIFGIRHSPEEVIDLVSERIPKAFDRAVLAQVIVSEILPTLLIRQSALYLFGEAQIDTLYQQALPDEEHEPARSELDELLTRSRRYLPPPETEGPRSWVRLVMPLSLQSETIGVWLIGRRDPDDFYPATDIHLLSTVANQIAPMVENIRLYERAQQEIAQRKAAEVEIRRSEERFRTLFEATLEGIAIVRNGVILEVNEALLAIFGYASGEIIGRSLADLFSDSTTELTGTPRECIGFKVDGTPVDIEVAGKKYIFQGEDVTVVAIRDIARRKADEAENKMLQRQLLHSQKMEAIGRLSAGVAHDFNNCLLAIFGYSDLLRDRYRDDPFLYRNLTGIKEAGQKAATLTKQLLAFARRQSMESRVMDLNLVVGGLDKMLQRLLGEDISLVTDLHPGLGKVRIDPGQMEQVIVNLAVNARHAMPNGGTISLRTAPLLVTGEIPAPHGNIPPGSYVLMTVADTGLGMDAETQARVFEPFFSTKGEGTGLGLSTAYGIVQQSRGHIFVDSAPGKGAVFSIYLPVTQDEETGVAAPVSTSPDTGTETVLLVEDEDEVRTVLHQILTGKGYRVFQASSGAEGLAIARLARGPIHLLLTDVTMPQMKGTELAARLRAERPQTRVIFMSGYNEETLPADELTCLQKPFSARTLTQAVRAILDATEEERPQAAASA